MKNRSLLKILSGVLMSGLLVACMGLEDTAPNATLMMPEVKNLRVMTSDGYDYELWAAVTEVDVAKIAECGFYVSEHPNMHDAVKIESKLHGYDFLAEISMTDVGKKKYVCAYLLVSTGYEICSEVKSIVVGELFTANCYMISKSGTYKFRTTKGNSAESVGNIKSVEVLWESFGTDVTPNKGELISSVSYADGYVTFATPAAFREGNAVIAAKDTSGKILWSWHIWLTDEPGLCYYRNVDGAMMDRNLGATSATPGDVGALGLLYQWGRKDPFLGSSSISKSIEAKSTISWPSAVSSYSSGTVEYAIEHPTTFITFDKSNWDWYYTGNSSVDNTRWQSEKTIYDPCPAGWRVPDGGSDGVWAKSGFDDQDYDDSDEGLLFGSGISSPATWYPAAGCRYGLDGGSVSVGKYGCYWSTNASCLIIHSTGHVNPIDETDLANGQSVRCLQE